MVYFASSGMQFCVCVQGTYLSNSSSLLWRGGGGWRERRKKGRVGREGEREEGGRGGREESRHLCAVECGGKLLIKKFSFEQFREYPNIPDTTFVVACNDVPTHKTIVSIVSSSLNWEFTIKWVVQLTLLQEKVCTKCISGTRQWI